ncbi:uncharacterized protein [Setaria viridis]|uniref:uncharacterized protein n=1 Tax=Setaria viridis TaxID=4556 RepID=UPI003B3B2D36
MAPANQETLYLYISAMTHIVSNMLVVEREEPSHAHMVQRLVYYVSEDVNSQVVKWSMELDDFDLDFCMRHAIKSQILADFVAEWTEIKKLPSLERPKHWTMIKCIVAYGDSKVIIEQVNKNWDCTKESMGTYCTEIRKLEAYFDGLKFHHVPRDHNVAANVLSKLGSKHAHVLASIFEQDLWKPSIKVLDLDQVNNSVEALTFPAPADVMMIEAEEDWSALFIALITHQMVPKDKIECEKLARRSANYVIIGKELYRKAASTGILMKCILRKEGIDLLHEIHSGTCGNHTASGTLVGKAFRCGFYWPTVVADAKELFQRCKGCQFFSKQQHLPSQALRTIPPSWPFTCWGLDMVGPFKIAPSGYTHMFMVVYKFTKWIEEITNSKAVISIESAKPDQFIEEITHRFGVPNRINTDLGKQFASFEFWVFCQDNLMDVYYSEKCLKAKVNGGKVKYAHKTGSRCYIV